jgi:hypothetical protein
MTTMNEPTISAAVASELGGPAPTPRLGRVLWDAWKSYSKRGSYQTEVLLSLVFFLVLGPSMAIQQTFGKKLLDLDPKPRPSYWIKRPPAEKTMAWMERQF